MARTARLHHLLTGFAAAIWLVSPGAAQTIDDNSRGVHIIEEAPASAAPVAPSPSTATPSLPSVPTPYLPSAPVPSLAAPTRPSLPDAGQAGLGSASPPTLGATPPAALGATPPANLGALQSSLTAKNPAGISVEILPHAELKVGEKIALRVATKTQGYLVLVDVDAAGKLTQIYPNRRSLLLAQDSQETANLIKPGERITIPERGNPYAGFEFVASPPAGVAMIIAILSDRPVQMLDLPDIPPSLVGQSAAVSYLTNWTRNLRIARAGGGPDHLQEATWSFDAKLYVIR